jgi:hypothetical protein
MITKKFVKTITTVLLFTTFSVMFTSYVYGQGMMHDNSGSMGMNNWNWGQFVIGIGIGLLVGILLGFMIFNKKK